MLGTPRPLSSLFFALVTSPLRFSSSSSNLNPKTLKTLKTLPRRASGKPKSATGGDRRALAGAAIARRDTDPAPITQIASNPDAESICSLLSEPSDRRRDLDDLLKDFKPKLTSNLVFETLKNYRKLGRSQTLEFFSWAGLHLAFRLDDPVVEFMADFLGRRKLFDDLKWLLKTVSSNKGQVSTRTVAIGIRFLGRNGRVVEAIALFEAMEAEFNCRPDNLVFNNVLYVLCKKDSSFGSVDVALTIFHQIGRPDVYSYSNIIVGLCRSGRLENALEVFREMGLAKLAPTRSAANVLIGQLCEIGGKSGAIEKVRVTDWRRPFDILVPNVGAKSGIEPAVEVFWAVANLGLLPSTHVVNGLVSVLCRLGMVEEAVEILKVVAHRTMGGIDESYAVVIRTLCELRRVDEASQLFERMIFLGLKPERIVYNSIIRAFCKLGNVAEAQKYFNIMNRRRCEPDCATYIVLIHAHCVTQNWEAAYELLMEMVGLGWHPHFDTYNLVDGLLKRNGRHDLSLKLERKMEVQDLFAHCKAGRLEAAYDKLSSMLTRGCHPPVYAIDAFETAFQRSGKWKIARDLLEKMDQFASQKIA